MTTSCNSYESGSRPRNTASIGVRLALPAYELTGSLPNILSHMEGLEMLLEGTLDSAEVTPWMVGDAGLMRAEESISLPHWLHATTPLP